ncbi:TM0106 family RecB-like putative nuclease [Conexibacter woesei]|uniref:TM0106 family RecB-like putative nuclease n=1 Tax=Conexibacter woesei TaxID=191495 RepID=UPI0004186D97|nr:TM0106 family RecB-like putative nuclease [Conexibacter woesei]
MPDRRLSPSSLNQFLGCEHRTYLDLRHLRGELEAEPLRPDATLLIERGERHEREVLERLAEGGREVVEIATTGPIAARLEATREAMSAGASVIHQACLADDDWVGYADFLVRVEEPSNLGSWSYEVHDAKLGSHPQPRHIFQLLFYNEQLAQLQGRAPASIHLALGSGESLAYPPGEFQAYAERVRSRFLKRRDELEPADADVDYPYPVADCDFCPWWLHCAKRRRADDHLSLVANLRRAQGLKLEGHEVHTVPGLAGLAPETKISRLADGTLRSLRAQADLQVRSRGHDRPLHELLEPEHDRGLARLPQPSAGDVFFDFEGDPFWGDDGLEYLFGTLYSDGSKWVYEARWATSRTEEKDQFEDWMGWITERLERHPDLHVFHYNSYEPTAVKTLMTRHSTCSPEVDDLLRRKIFVDLLPVVRQGVRIGTESYGLKAIEPAFGYVRRGADDGAIGSLRRWQKYLDSGEPNLLDAIATYNEDDCRSTLALREWLWNLRDDAEAEFGVALDRLEPEPGRDASRTQLEYRARLERAREQLATGLPDDASEDDDEQRVRRLAFDLVGYHEREDKPEYWEFFARADSSDDDLRDDSAAIAGLRPVPGREREEEGANWRWHLSFPPQDYKLHEGSAWDPDAGDDGYGVTIEALDPRERTLSVKRAKKHGDAPPARLIPGMPVPTNAQKDALFRFADRLSEDGFDPCDRFDAATDLLLRRAPRFTPGTPALTEGPIELDTLVEQAAGLNRSVLVVQGPPGTGKTFLGARVAVELMRRHGLRIGVMATAHKAIAKFLEDVDDYAAETGFSFAGWKKKGENDDGNYASDTVTCSASPSKRDPPQLLGATSWFWARESVFEDVDVLFVDEAGQVSLADAIAVSQGTKSIVLLGDPQQLPHVSHGTHLHGSGASVLEHVFGEAQTIARDRGVFLDRTWRMHPDVCRFVSDAMYDGALLPIDACSRQVVASPGLSGTGLRLLTVEHSDNRQRSEKEAAIVAAAVEDLLDGGTFTDRDGTVRALDLEDILVVAPYNAQVRTLRGALREGVRVGTVDKFQGQQAPVVFFSMASSSGEDVPRGMDFLFNRNRLNVAVSRAQALAVVVCSPRLMSTRCSTVEQMKLVNMLCQFAAAAT